MAPHVESLGNGLRVVLQPIQEARTVSCWITYRVGSRNERPGTTGSTHWVEHMLFKGGGRFKKGDIDRLIGRLGGKMNAFTDADFTAYFETVPVTAMDVVLSMEAERMRKAAFDPKEVEAERTVVLSEREGAENQPEFLVEEEIWALAFHLHPYHWTPIGYRQDLALMDRETLYRHYLRFYAPNNAILVLTGAFDPAVAMQRIRETFDPLTPEPPPEPVGLIEPEQHGERRSELRRPGATDLLAMAWKVPPYAHKDTPALLILATILGGWRGLTHVAAGEWRPRSTRLYRAIVETKLATEVGVRHELRIDPSLLLVNVTLAPTASLDRVEDAVDGEVDRLRRIPPSKAELDRAREQIRAWTRYEQDGVTYRGMLLSLSEVLASWNSWEETVRRLDRVRPEQVRDAARQYLVEDHRSVVRFHHEEVSR